MTTALSFQSTTFNVIDHNNRPWIRSAELAAALGYASEKSVSNLYARNADEFSCEMSVVINLMTGENSTEVRIFSLRGCHLLAMFARTAVAKAFRVWVLDVLDNHVGVEAPASLPTSPITPDQQCTLQNMVKALVDKGGIYAAIWSRFNNHFRLGSYKQLPQSSMGEAITYLMNFDVTSKALSAPKQKALPKAKPKTLPPSPDVQREKLPLPYPFPKEKIDVLLAQVSYHMLKIRHAEQDITEIMAAESRRNNPGAPVTLLDKAYSRRLYLSCSTGSLWQSVDFALRAIEESINLRLESGA